MDILGYVRMNYKEGLHYTKMFGAHKDEWFKELNTVIREKEEELVKEVKHVRRYLNLENIVIQYLREKKEDVVNITVIKKLVIQIADEISSRGLFFAFRDHHQLNDDYVETLLSKCKRLWVDYKKVYTHYPFEDIQCFNPNTAVDFRILDIIREFIAKEKNDVR